MDRIKFLEHKGKNILYLDFSGIKYEEGKKLIFEAQKIIRSSPPNSMLTLNNFTDAEVSPQAMNDLKEFVLLNKPFVKAAAVIGIGGIKKILLNTVMKFSGRKFYVFNNIEEAKDWLANLP